MSTRFLLAVLIGVLFAGCTLASERQIDLDEIHGIWILDSFDGQLVEVGVNTEEMPWIRIADGFMDGSLGCNGFSMDRFELDGFDLVPGGLARDLAGCLNGQSFPLVTAEEVLIKVFGQDRIAVDVTDDAMEWRAGGSVLSFTRRSSSDT